jgi:hypothetical protein
LLLLLLLLLLLVHAPPLLTVPGLAALERLCITQWLL